MPIGKEGIDAFVVPTIHGRTGLRATGIKIESPLCFTSSIDYDDTFRWGQTGYDTTGIVECSALTHPLIEIRVAKPAKVDIRSIAYAVPFLRLPGGTAKNRSRRCDSPIVGHSLHQVRVEVRDPRAAVGSIRAIDPAGVVPRFNDAIVFGRPQ